MFWSLRVRFCFSYIVFLVLHNFFSKNHFNIVAEWSKSGFIEKSTHLQPKDCTKYPIFVVVSPPDPADRLGCGGPVHRVLPLPAAGGRVAADAVRDECRARRVGVSVGQVRPGP